MGNILALRFKIFLVLILAIWVAGCQTQPPVNITPTPDLLPTVQATEPDPNCPPADVQRFLSQTKSLLQEFDTLAVQAETTAPEALIPVIQELEEQTRSIAAVPTPPCALQAQAALNEYFMHQIQGYFRVHAAALEVTPQSDRTALDEFQAANDKLAWFNKLAHDLAETAGIE